MTKIRIRKGDTRVLDFASFVSQKDNAGKYPSWNFPLKDGTVLSATQYLSTLIEEKSNMGELNTDGYVQIEHGVEDGRTRWTVTQLPAGEGSSDTAGNTISNPDVPPPVPPPPQVAGAPRSVDMELLVSNHGAAYQMCYAQAIAIVAAIADELNLQWSLEDARPIATTLYMSVQDRV